MTVLTFPHREGWPSFVASVDRRDYAEASFFDGYHFQHIADWLDVARLKRAEDAHAAFRRRHPNTSNLWL